jgi:hypothetical protein
LQPDDVSDLSVLLLRRIGQSFGLGQISLHRPLREDIFASFDGWEKRPSMTIDADAANDKIDVRVVGDLCKR